MYTLKTHSLFFATVVLTAASYTQVPAGGGLIVNEINQGASGIKEFMEFLVLGDPADPCAPVDLTGWVFDDNNGSFETCGTGVGIATGHYRFTSCYSAVPPGSLLVVYNAADVYTGMPASDPLDADADGVYMIPSNNACLEANYTVPVSSPATCTYAGAYIAPNLTWAAGMSNSGDVAQLRKPDYTFFHGFSYGDVNTVFPAWPTGAAAGNSFNKGSGNLALDCGSCWSSSAYITTTAGSGTPGAANTVNNGYFIDHLQNCTLNYADLSDPDNCALILDLEDNSVIAYATPKGNVIEWQDPGETFTQVEILRSADGVGTTLLSGGETDIYKQSNASFAFTDTRPFSPITYYQVIRYDAQMQKNISPLIAVKSFALAQHMHLSPNPAHDIVQVALADDIEVYDVVRYSATGEYMFTCSTEESRNLSFSVHALQAGVYILRITSRQGIFSGVFVKQ